YSTSPPIDDLAGNVSYQAEVERGAGIQWSEATSGGSSLAQALSHQKHMNPMETGGGVHN
ncbi:unnamed protein product, partial [Urochloa humidicola]